MPAAADICPPALTSQGFHIDEPPRYMPFHDGDMSPRYSPFSSLLSRAFFMYVLHEFAQMMKHAFMLS